VSRRAVLCALQVAGTLGLLVLAWRLADGSALVERLAAVRPGWLLLALALTVPMQALSAWRWKLVAGALGAPIELRRALGDYYLAALLNATLPGGVVGDAARVWRHGRRRHGRRNVPRPCDGDGRFERPLGAVLIERGAGQAALALVLAMGLAHAATARGGVLGLAGDAGGRFTDVVVAAALMIVLGGALLVVAGLATVAALGAATGSMRGALARFGADLRRLARTPAVCAGTGVLSLAVVGTYIGVFLLTARALGPIGAPPTVALLALVGVPLVLVTMLAPISVGGLGPREAAAAALWPVLGSDAASGAAAALLYGVVIVLGSAPGALAFSTRPRAVG